ncbi:hypothetical protein RSOLAG22IIIB_01705 [Rhizoctonia solani]|uniref:Uncharacterized protein n=1 Tax=Rhizoctonia solani TaxID=456999 RepID=A0A0K6G9B6_9AGAM|nr:hypothetical protein RSOLAG22IIIB_01705 [Rhizoctonia solani]
MKQTSLVSSLSRTPSSAVKRFLWRRQIWFESTFALSMLEPWEKMLIMGVLLFLSSLFVTGAVRYLPNHVSVVVARAGFYLNGSSNTTLPIQL